MHNLYENSDFNCKRIDIAGQFCLYIHRPQFNHNTHMYIRSITQNLYKNIENTSWKELAYGIYARVVDVLEIERVSAANE